MGFNRVKASKNLCELDFKFSDSGLDINVLWFRTTKNSAAWVIPRHMHSSYEFHFVMGGSCEVITDEGSFIAQKGEFYLTAPSRFHEQRSLAHPYYLEYSLNCDLIVSDKTLPEATEIVNIFDTAPCKVYKDSFHCLKLFHKALEEAYFEKIGFYGSIQNLIFLILVNAARSMSQDKPQGYPIPKKIGRNSFRMSQIERFVEDNISTALPTAVIAANMYLSEKQICRIIREEKGMSTKEFVNGVKLSKAKELLKNSGLPIKKISDLLGFSSEYYFSQFFKRLEGYPPATYRANLQNG